jgi:hypothetical protein
LPSRDCMASGSRLARPRLRDEDRVPEKWRSRPARSGLRVLYG